jgi:flagellar assembly protein FliH
MGRIVKAALGPSGQAATATVPAAVEEVAAALAAARAEANRERAAAKDVAVILARKMAEKIIGHAVEIEPLVMRDIAAHALQSVSPGQESVLLRLHPDDLARLQAERPDWLMAVGLEAGVRAVADVSVGRLGCVVETASTRLDARLDAQLDALERALRGSGLGRG